MTRNKTQKISEMERISVPSELTGLFENFRRSGGWGDPSTHPYPIGTKVKGHCMFCCRPQEKKELEFLGTERRFCTGFVYSKFDENSALKTRFPEMYKGLVDGKVCLIIPAEEYEDRLLYLYKCLECGATGAPSVYANVGVNSYTPYKSIR